MPRLPIDPRCITGLVLAGGRGSRMGGIEKGLQPFRGKPLVEHVLQRFAPQVGPLLVSANRLPERYAAFGHPVIADPDDGTSDRYAGPLAGLRAGLARSSTDHLAMVPCDAPFLSPRLVARLSEAFDDATCNAAVASVGGLRQPVFCLVRRSLLDDLTDYLRRGGRAAGAWIERVDGRAVSFDDERAFRNLNTVDDLLDAEGHADAD